MADAEILNYYKIGSLFPSEWPDEKNLDDEEDESNEEIGRNIAAEYESSRLRRRQTSDAQTTGERLDTSQSTKQSTDTLDISKGLVDPLGLVPDVRKKLIENGLPVDRDIKLLNRFRLDSKFFSPDLFMAEVHGGLGANELSRGLEHLSRSIDKNSTKLKSLVVAKLDDFVRVKSTIDNIYDEMRTASHDDDTSGGIPRINRMSLGTTGKGSVSGSMSSGTFSPRLVSGFSRSSIPARRNLLTKECDYGVALIKAPLSELVSRAEKLWNGSPQREDEKVLRSVLKAVEGNLSLFELAAAVDESIKRRDFDALVEEFMKARKLKDEARDKLIKAKGRGISLSESEIHGIMIVNRMWESVRESVEKFKMVLWRRIKDVRFLDQNGAWESVYEEHMEIIRVLLELGVTENPIWVWLTSRLAALKRHVVLAVRRVRREIEILRRRLLNSEPPRRSVVLTHFKSAGSDIEEPYLSSIDSQLVLGYWDHLYHCINMLLSLKGGWLSEMSEFWSKAETFMDKRGRKSLPAGYNNESVKYHELSRSQIEQLRSDMFDLICIVRDGIHGLFNDSGYQEMETQAIDENEITLGNEEYEDDDIDLSVLKLGESNSVHQLDDSTVSTRQRSEIWQKFAFWPPHANSMSGAYNLNRCFTVIITAAIEMGTWNVYPDKTQYCELLKSLINTVRDRSIQAICLVWDRDSLKFCLAEDWIRNADARELTHFPDRLKAFSTIILNNLQKICFFSDVSNATQTASLSREILLPPSSKLLQSVENQFIESLLKVFAGMIDNVISPTTSSSSQSPSPSSSPSPRPSSSHHHHYHQDSDSLELTFKPVNPTKGRIDATNQNIRLLLTLSNFNSMQTLLIPELLRQFETGFSVKLPVNANVLFETLGRLTSHLFAMYVDPIVNANTHDIVKGIDQPGNSTSVASKSSPLSPSYALSTLDPDGKPVNARPYVYSVLMRLVMVHSEISTEAGVNSLLSPVLKHLLEKLSAAQLTALRRYATYDLNALIQATLDVEFLAQTLQAYTTNTVSETQSAIYLTMDERTDHYARIKLQEELPSMRSVLKRIRDATRTEFACFKQRSNPTSSSQLRST